MTDRCYGCGRDPASLAIGEACPCTPPPPTVPACVRCGGPLTRASRGRPPKICLDCSPRRRHYRRKIERALRS